MTQQELMILTEELLEAHLDTLELALTPATDREWAVHVDYLRALQRRGRELLATDSEMAGR